MARLDYGYLRPWDLESYVDQLHAQGYGGAMFQLSDPRLPALVARARQLGLKYGIWEDPHAESPAAFAHRMSEAIRHYGAAAAGLDLEADYKGWQGSAGWNRNNELAAQWRALMPAGFETVIMPMGSEWAGKTGNPTDFNVKAWQGLATGWNPQAYGGNMEAFDNQAIVQGFVNSGVPIEMIAPLLGQNNLPYGGGALYGLNEMGQLPKASGPATPPPGTGGSGAPTSGTTRTTQSRYTGPDAVLHLRPGQRVHGLSQSKSEVREHGLRWGGQMFDNKQQFQKYLSNRGQSYANWAAKHKQAAAGLKGR